MSRIVTLICAAGSQERWKASGGRGRKQLIEIDGEPIIERTYRLASQHSDEVITLVREPWEACWANVNPHEPAYESWMGEMGKILDGRPHWPEEGRVVILHGDVYYSEATINTIFGHEPDQPTVYARARAGLAEAFGFSFLVPDHVEETERIAHSVASYPKLNRRGGLWRWFWHRHTGEQRYRGKKNVVPLATPANGWIEVGHDETDDFDVLGDLRSWRTRYLRPAREAA